MTSAGVGRRALTWERPGASFGTTLTMPAPVIFSVDADRVGWLVFDDPAARANVFNPAVQRALGAALDGLAAAPVKAVVAVSAKERIFIAGADLKIVAALGSAAEAERFASEGQARLQRVAEFPVPVVCAIDGACAGGGYEFALACHGRIASERVAVQIGLPEVNLGLIPGWGGCVRLPRLIGVRAALDHVLRGQLVPAGSALAGGLVDEVVPADALRLRAKARALELAAVWAEGQSPRQAAQVPATAAREAGFFAEQRVSAATRLPGPAVAALAAIEVIERTVSLDLTAALAVEARAFGEVAARPESKSLISEFFARQAAKKRPPQG